MWVFLAGVVIILAAVIAYANSFGVPFVFDDIPSIANNPAIRQWNSAVALTQGPGGLTVNGRPLVGLALALNHWLGGDAVWGFHAVNLLIHALAGLVLFGVVRRTLESRILRSNFKDSARFLALLIALLWTVHPLQTESVTYVIQRAESLMGLCYLVSLYGYIRSVGSPVPRLWQALSVAACLLGAICKEVIVTAPLVVFLYDRTFVSGSFLAAWRNRRGYYLGLASSWLLLAGLVAGASGRGGTAGYGTEVSSWAYALTQCRAVLLYLKLAIWPAPLVFDYGTAAVGNLAEVWAQTLAVSGLVAATVWALVRRPALGFCGAVFFMILAPSSSVVPIATQTIAEHRMYLPLAAVLALVVVGLSRFAGRTTLFLGALVAVGLIGMTVARNQVYRSALTLWADTVEKQPANARAQNNLGYELFVAGRMQDALSRYVDALQLEPNYAEAHFNIAVALARLGRTDEAIGHYQESLRLQPAFAQAHNNLGLALESVGRVPEALEHYETATRLAPDFAAAFYNSGSALAQLGRMSEAVARLEEAVRLKPDYLGAHNNLGNVLLELDRVSEAISHYETVLRLNPDFVPARRNLLQVLIRLDRVPEAVDHLQVLARLLPDDPEVRQELARLQRR